MNGEVVFVESVSRAYGSGKRKKVAVDGVSLSVGRGEVFGLIGPNGAGKSTLLKMIMGLVPLDAGEIRVFGDGNWEFETKRKIGYLPEHPVRMNYLNGREFLDYMARLSGSKDNGLNEAILEIAKKVGIEEGLRKRVSTLSKGMVQRLYLAQALVHSPSLLILDEPTTGLDPLGVIEFRDIILNLKKNGTTVIISTHNLTELEKICDTVGFMLNGNIKSFLDMHSPEAQAYSLEQHFVRLVEEQR